MDNINTKIGINQPVRFIVLTSRNFAHFYITFVLYHRLINIKAKFKTSF